jgi:hypothetical protein
VSFVYVRVSHRAVRSICRFWKPPRTGEVLPIFLTCLFIFYREDMLELALSSKKANKGEQWRQQGYVHGGNSSVNLASHGHCAGVLC